MQCKRCRRYRNKTDDNDCILHVVSPLRHSRLQNLCLSLVSIFGNKTWKKLEDNRLRGEFQDTMNLLKLNSASANRLYRTVDGSQTRMCDCRNEIHRHTTIVKHTELRININFKTIPMCASRIYHLLFLDRNESLEWWATSVGPAHIAFHYLISAMILTKQ